MSEEKSLAAMEWELAETLTEIWGRIVVELSGDQPRP